MKREVKTTLAILPLAIVLASLTFVSWKHPNRPTLEAVQAKNETVTAQVTGRELNVSTDAMDGRKKFTLIVLGDEEGHVNLAFWCSSSRDLMAVVSSDDVVDQGSVRVKFDNNSPLTQTWRESSNNAALFAPNPKHLMNQLGISNRFMFEYSRFREGKRIVTFDVSGLHEGIPKLNAACRL